jgi:GR25 family glycosyltransferase involved in LPS biosynthesis
MHGLYINMDKSPLRRSKLEGEIARVGLTEYYRRIRGVVDPVPYHGCSKSHIRAMTEAAKIGGVVHIVEDDILMSDRVEAFLRSDRLKLLLETYDIIYLSMWVDPNPQSAGPFYLALQQAGDDMALVDMRGPRIGAMDSYVVAPRSIGKIVTLMTNEMARTKMFRNDVYIDTLVKAGELKAAAIVPFLTCVDIDTGTRSSLQTLERQDQERYVMLRTSFFVDRDRQPSFPMEEVAAIVR